MSVFRSGKHTGRAPGSGFKEQQHERETPAARQRAGGALAHDCKSGEEENGGWYRDRTCDPYHVNARLHIFSHNALFLLCFLEVVAATGVCTILAQFLVVIRAKTTRFEAI